MRPRTRQSFAGTIATLRSRVGQAQRQLLPKPRELRHLNPSKRESAEPTELDRQDATARWHCEQAARHLKQAEEAWDDPPTDRSETA